MTTDQLHPSDDHQGRGEPRSEPMVLLELFPDNPGESLDEWAHGRLRTAVLDGGLSLTPVLGPECLDGGHGFAHRGPAGLIQTVALEDVERHIQEHCDDKRHHFFVELKRSRLQGRVVESRNLDAALDSMLLDLQLATFECAFEATRLFAETWGRAPSPVTDWMVHDISIGDEDLDRLDVCLANTIEALDRITAGPWKIDQHYLLGAASIDMRVRSLRGSLSESQRLQSSWIEWLTDLFWHTVIFDSRCYPRVDELALQVSLVGTSKNRPIRHLEPSATIERGSVREFRRAVIRSVRRGFRSLSVASVRSGFHGALANVLHAQFAEWERRGRESKRPFAFPIAVSTTFDLELERALAVSNARRRSVFHVALPVVHVTRGFRRGRLRWIVGTFSVLGEAHQSEDRLWRALTVPEGEGWKWLDHVARIHATPELDGPLILKVNGSPLHEVEPDISSHPGLQHHPSNRSKLNVPTGGQLFSLDGSKPEYLYHAPALAEFDLLQITHVDEWAYGARHSGDNTIDQGLPIAITSQLDNADRFWLIAGQRLDDWSARMQLFLHVSRALIKSTALPSALAVARGFDRDRARMLDGLGISRAAGDFEALSSILHRIAVDAAARA